MPAVFQAGEHSKGCRGLATLASRAWQRAARACAFGWGGESPRLGATMPSASSGPWRGSRWTSASLLSATKVGHVRTARANRSPHPRGRHVRQSAGPRQAIARLRHFRYSDRLWYPCVLRVLPGGVNDFTECPSSGFLWEPCE